MCTDAHTSACCGLGVHFWIRLMQMSQSSACNNPEKDFTAFGSACVEMQMDANVAPGSLVLLTTKDKNTFSISQMSADTTNGYTWPHCAHRKKSSPGGQANSDWRRWGIWFQWSPGLRSWNHLKSAVIGMRELKRCAWSYFCHPKIVIRLVDRQQAQLVENGGDLGLLAAGSKIGCNGCPYFSAWLFDGPYFTNDFCHTQITQIIQITQITQCSAAVLLEDFQDQCLESTYFDLGLSVANVRGLELQWLLFTSPSDSLQVVPQGILGKL